MKQNFETLRSMRPYFKRGLVAVVSIVILGCGLLVWKGPTLAKNIAISSLERNLASLGIEQVEVETISFGWGRIYLRDIHTKIPSSGPNLSIQEMNIALSVLLNIKAMDVVGATFELKKDDKISGYEAQLHEKVVHFGKVIEKMKHLKLPAIALRDCLLVIPTSHGSLKIPVHAATETTVKRGHVLTVDWGEQGENAFSGQIVLETGRSGTTLDVHSVNVDIQASNFHIKAPEISLWSNLVDIDNEGCEIDGFARVDHLMLGSFGNLKVPLEINLSVGGTPDDLLIDELTITGKGIEANLFELEGTLKPYEASAQLDLTARIPQLSKLWDFTQLLATHGSDKVSVGGKVSLAGELFFEKGKLVASPLAIDIRDASLSREGFSIEGLASQFVFNGIVPLVTKGQQRMSVKKITANGINLKNVSLEGFFDRKGLLQINRLKARALNGKLEAHRFKRFKEVSYPAFQFEVDFENIELSEILKLTNLASLSGQAKLAGNASMRYDLKDGLDVIQAELHSVSESGIIQYRPEISNMEEGTHNAQNVAFQVLDNLHFSLFDVRISRAPDNPSEMQGVVKMLGSNPNVLNGYPFEFNILTVGKLKDLVINTLQHMKPPADLKQLNQAIKATKDAKEAKSNQAAEDAKVTEDTKVIKAAKVVKAAKSVKKTKAVKVFKKKSKLKNKNRKMKDV